MTSSTVCGGSGGTKPSISCSSGWTTGCSRSPDAAVIVWATNATELYQLLIGRSGWTPGRLQHGRRPAQQPESVMGMC